MRRWEEGGAGEGEGGDGGVGYLVHGVIYKLSERCKTGGGFLRL